MTQGIMVIGSINHDSVYNVERLPKPHETIPAGGFVTAPGGKGSNQAVACAQACERPVYLLGCIGADMQADFCLSYLRENKVDVSGVSMLDNLPTGTACVIVEKSGNNLIVVSAGANGGLQASHIEQAKKIMADYSIVLMQLEVPMPRVREGLVLARELGKVSILNPAPYFAGVEKVISLADIVTPNETEATSLSGVDVKDFAGAKKAAKLILDVGAHNVVVTLGAEGSLVATQTETRFIPAYRVDHVVDTSGAGDVYNGALAAALADGADLVAAADFASAAAALSVQKPTASYCAPSREEIRAAQSSNTSKT